MSHTKCCLGVCKLMTSVKSQFHFVLIVMYFFCNCIVFTISPSPIFINKYLKMKMFLQSLPSDCYSGQQAAALLLSGAITSCLYLWS